MQTKEEKCLFGDEITINSLKIDATHENDNDLLLRQETQKKYGSHKDVLIGGYDSAQIADHVGLYIRYSL